MKTDHVPKIKEQYDNLEKFLAQGQYMAGDEVCLILFFINIFLYFLDFCLIKVTLADFSIVTILSTTRIFVKIGLRWPHLRNYYKKMAQLPYYQKGNVPGLQAISIGIQHTLTNFPLNL